MGEVETGGGGQEPGQGHLVLVEEQEGGVEAAGGQQEGRVGQGEGRQGPGEDAA